MRRNILVLLCSVVFILLSQFAIAEDTVSGLSEFNRTYSPPDPMTSYEYKELDDWTTWNKFLFASAIGGQVADITSTKIKLDEGCSEGNHIYGSDPTIIPLVVLKTIGMGVVYWGIENWTQVEDRQTSRNIAWSVFTIGGLGVAAYNMNVECY